MAGSVRSHPPDIVMSDFLKNRLIAGQGHFKKRDSSFLLLLHDSEKNFCRHKIQQNCKKTITPPGRIAKMQSPGRLAGSLYYVVLIEYIDLLRV